MMKYITVSVAAHCVIAAAALGIGVAQGSNRNQVCVEMVRLALPSSESDGGIGADEVKPAGAKPAGSCEKEHVREYISEAVPSEKSVTAAHEPDSRALYYTPLVVEPSNVSASEEIKPSSKSLFASGAQTLPDSGMGGRSDATNSGLSGGGGALHGGEAGIGSCGHMQFGESGGPGIIELARPDYPARAVRMHKGGSVLLRLSIDKDGSLSSVTVEESAGYGLDEAALEAARRSRFRPAVMDGTPVRCMALLPYRFVLASR